MTKPSWRWKRRDLLIIASTAAAASAVSAPYLISRLAKRKTLRIAVSEWIPDWLRDEAVAACLVPMAKELKRELVVQIVPNERPFQNGGKYDAYLTSSSFHGWSKFGETFFGALPYGMMRAEKIDWLITASARKLQQDYFAQYQLFAQPLAVGPDIIGAFARKDALSPETLSAATFQKVRIASPVDIRAQWLKAAGLKPIKVSPYAQGQALKSGLIDATEPLTPGPSLKIAESLSDRSQELSYVLFPGFRTAPVVSLFWWNERRNELSDSMKKKTDQIAEATYQALNRKWAALESQNLAKIQSKFAVSTVPESISRVLANESSKYIEISAKQSELSQRVARAYEQARTQNLILG